MNKAMYFLLKMVEISNNRHVSELRGVFIQRAVFLIGNSILVILSGGFFNMFHFHSENCGNDSQF